MASSRLCARIEASFMWLRARLFFAVFVATLAAAGSVWASPNEVVLIEDGWRGQPEPILQRRADSLARLVGKGLGAKTPLVGRCFTEVDAGLAYVVKKRVRFALLS